MEFLKEILGDKFGEFEGLINNFNEANKDKAIKLANLTGGDYVAKDKYNSLDESQKELRKQLEDRDKQLDELKKASGDSEALKNKILELQDANEKAKLDFEAKTKDLSISNAIKLAISGKVHDVDLVSSLFDKNKIELDENGTIKAGIDDQLKTLSETKGFLFVDAKKGFEGAKPADGAGNSGGNNLDAFLQGFEGK